MRQHQYISVGLFCLRNNSWLVVRAVAVSIFPCSSAAFSLVFFSRFCPFSPDFFFYFSNFPTGRRKSGNFFFEASKNCSATVCSILCGKVVGCCCTSFLLNNFKCLKSQDLSFSVSLTVDPPKWLWVRYRMNFLHKWGKQTESPVYCDYACLCRKLK